MTTSFSVTFDVRHGLALVAGETIVTDLVGLHIDRNPDGTFACAVTRAGGGPVQIVPESSRAGQQAMRANGRLDSPVPGFVGVPATSLTADIAKCFGWQPAGPTD